jgi:hypothetical protein
MNKLTGWHNTHEYSNGGFHGAAALQAISKPQLLKYCHSERSEESRIFNWLRSFTPFRMTDKTGFEIASSLLLLRANQDNLSKLMALDRLWSLR